MKKLIFALFLVGSFMMSCNTAPSTKQEYLNQYGSFMEEIKKNSKSYTAEEWAEKDKEFAKFSSELQAEFKEDLGFLEKATLVKYGLNYAKYRGACFLKGASKDGSQTVEGISTGLKEVLNGDEFKEALDGVKNIWNDDTKKEFESALGELKTVWDSDVKEELGASLEEVERSLNDEKVQAEISSKIKELENVLNDEEVKSKVKDAISELKTVLEKVEQEMDK